MNDILALVAAIFSAIATGLAVIATWRAPVAAARLAENLRRDAEHASERRKQKLYVFSLLMEERARIYSDNGVRALNLVDLVFSDSPAVRDAWSELFATFNFKPLPPPHIVSERLLRLLSAIAKDIGLADDLRSDDLSRIYFPQVQEQEQLIKDIATSASISNIACPESSRSW